MEKYKEEMELHIKTMRLQLESIGEDIDSQKADIAMANRYIELHEERLTCVRDRLDHAIKIISEL